MTAESGSETLEGNLDKLVEIVAKQILEKVEDVKPRTDFEFLAKFIRAKKYNTDAAVGAICKYYKGIQSRLDLFEGSRAADSIGIILKSGSVKVLRGQVNKTTVIYVSFQKWDPREMPLEQLMLAYSFFIEEALMDPHFQTHGGMGIIDLNGLSFAHVKECGYSAMKFAVKNVLSTYPIRVAAIHHLNPPIIFWPIFKIAQKFFPAKIRQRVKFFEDKTELLDFIPSTILPKSLGGQLEEEEAWDDSIFNNLIHTNPCYNSYWENKDA